MKLFELERNPTRRQLRQFGAATVIALPLIGWIWGAEGAVVGALAGIGLALFALALVHPPALRPLFVGLSLVTLPVGWALGELALLVIYFGVLTPFGLVFRLLRRDALQLRPDPSARSFWQRRKPPRETSSYFRQS